MSDNSGTDTDPIDSSPDGNGNGSGPPTHPAPVPMDATPSEKYVCFALHFSCASLTAGEISSWTKLPESTVYDALRELTDRGEIEVVFGNCGRRLFSR